MTLRILPLGDSITRGTYWSGPTGPGPQGGWRAELERLLDAAGCTHRFVGDETTWSAGMRSPNHQGIGGWGLEGILKGATAAHASSRPLAEILACHRPDVVLLMAGTNDLAWLPGEAVLARLEAVIRAIHTALPDCCILVSSVLPRTVGRYGPDGMHASTAEAVAATAAFNRSLPASREGWRAAGLPVQDADAAAAVLDAERDLVDHVHPDQETQVRMAGLWFAALGACGLVDPRFG